MKSVSELQKILSRLHRDLNSWPHNTPEGREMRAHFGKRIQAIQLVMEMKKETFQADETSESFNQERGTR